MVSKNAYNHIVKDYYPIVDYLKGVRNRLSQLSTEKKLPNSFSHLTNENIISIHIGAHNEKRIIPQYLICDVIRFAKEQNFKVVLIGTEKELAEEIKNATDNYPLYESLTLKEVKMLLKSSKLFIGSDSGILHMAGALDVNSIGIYGPKKSTESGPLSKEVSFLEQDLDCRPCNQNKPCPINVKCMNTLSSKALVDLAKKKLDLN